MKVKFEHIKVFITLLCFHAQNRHWKMQVKYGFGCLKVIQDRYVRRIDVASCIEASIYQSVKIIKSMPFLVNRSFHVLPQPMKHQFID